MLIDRVTMTGADDSVQVDDLVEVSMSYPEVEWGILFSGKMQGTGRFPSANWLAQLVRHPDAHKMKLSAHLCGGWVIGILSGRLTWADEYPHSLCRLFKRIQVNFHGQVIPETYRRKVKQAVMASPEFRFLIQVDGENDDVAIELAKFHLADPLFDLSSGAGIAPEAWPVAWPDTYCGYAGGLSPENIKEQLLLIDKKVDLNFPIWIDMETMVRSEKDRIFDLGKVKSVLQSVREFKESKRKD